MADKFQWLETVLLSQGAQSTPLAKETVQPVPHHRQLGLQPAGLPPQSPREPRETGGGHGWMELPPSAVGLPLWCPALPRPVSNVIPIPRAAAASGMELRGLNAVIHSLHASTKGLHLEKSTLQGEAGVRVGGEGGPQPNSAINTNSEQNTQPVCLGFLVCVVWKTVVMKYCLFLGLPRRLSDKESACQCRRCRRLGFDPWVGKTPCKRKWQPTPVFLPG